MCTRKELKDRLVNKLGWPENIAEKYLDYLESSNIVKDRESWLKDSKEKGGNN